MIVMREKMREYRKLIFLLCFFGVLKTAGAQENQPSPDQINPSDKKVDVLMGEQNSSTMLQSVSTVSGERLLHRPTFQMENFLDGTLPGLVTTISNGYSTSQSSLSLRGRSLLIVVDGIPRSDANIPASQIESVSVIKDGLGLSMMGMSSGNGILYIKTKRGEKSSMKIEFTGQVAVNQQTNRPNFLNSYDYSTLLNEALTNDGKAKMYSDADLMLYKTGASPYTHPDVDWYDQLTRENAPIQQYNLNIRGGGRTARYFIDLNVYDEQGFLKQDNSINTYDTRESFKKYSLRTNTDINLTENTIMKVNVFGQMFREITPGNAMMSSIYPAMHYTPNNAYPVTNPDGSISGNETYQNNLYAQTIYSGYYMYPKTDFNIDVTLEHKFTKALKGLYASGTYSYNSSYREQLNRTKAFDVYSYWKNPEDTSPDTEDNYTKLVTAGIQSNSTSYSRLNRLQYLELAAGYDFAIDEHSFRSKLAYSYNDYLLLSTALPLEKAAVSFRTEYDYDQRYLAEIGLSAMSLNQLKPGEQWGLFPSVGLGWNMDREDWFQSANIDRMKVRATYGVNGTDGTGSYYRSATGTLGEYYYKYLKYYSTTGSGIYTGGSPAAQSILTEANLPYLTKWEKINRFNLGVDVAAYNNSLNATAEFFHNVYSDILQQGINGYNDLMGIATPNENIGKYRQSGLELNLDYNKQFGDVRLSANVNATAYWTKKLVDAGLLYPEEYMERVGKPNNMIFGYVADGFFQSQTEINEYLKDYTVEGYVPMPGDLKYKDLNEDFIIDGKDTKDIGTKAPRIEYGIFLGAEWKGIALSTQWVGIANRSVTVQDTPFGINAQGGYGQALEEHLDRWTPTNTDAKYPRLSSVPNAYNERTSTFWLKDGGFLRLKNIELSYSLPQSWCSLVNLSNVKVFANGYNLLTISGIENRDPELLNLMSGTIPNTKAFNVGLNIQF